MELRRQNIAALSRNRQDVLIIGGGINGAACAAALATRGIRTGLLDARDFAGLTSQHSSNLIWGGVKYLENYEFDLVAELCKARNELMKRFPSSIREIRFVTTVPKGFRHHPAVLWAGAWLYWCIGRGYTRPPRYLRPEAVRAEEPIIDITDCTGGLEYSDAYLFDNDARFVFGLIRSAMDHGCQAANYVEAVRFQKRGEEWQITAKDHVSDQTLHIRSKVLVNATGAYVDTLNSAAKVVTRHQHILSKGIHLVVPRISESGKVLAFFADDGRLFFAIPMAHRTCIGTTDTRVDSPDPTVSDQDRDFVLSNINAKLKLPRQLTRSDIIAERCGVRPLVTPRGMGGTLDFLQLSRRHIVETHAEMRQISIFGGKLTDCIHVGEEVCQEVAKLLNMSLAAWPSCSYHEPDKEEKRAFMARAKEVGIHEIRAEDTGEPLSDRLWRRYGAGAGSILDRIRQDPDLTSTAVPGTGLRLGEIDYLREREMIVKLDDLLRRRSKLALLYRHQELAEMPGLRELCNHLFGNRGRAEFEGYFGGRSHGEGIGPVGSSG